MNKTHFSSPREYLDQLKNSLGWAIFTIYYVLYFLRLYTTFLVQTLYHKTINKLRVVMVPPYIKLEFCG